MCNYVLKCDQVQSYITHVYNTLVKISEAVYRAGLPAFFHICSNQGRQTGRGWGVSTPPKFWMGVEHLSTPPDFEEKIF